MTNLIWNLAELGNYKDVVFNGAPIGDALFVFDMGGKSKPVN